MTQSYIGIVEKRDQERFWAKVDKRGPDDCWPWLGGKGTRGYGAVPIGGRRMRASQASWMIANGKPFPEGMMACHTCDNPPCVNPAHIWPGTMSENLCDARDKGRLPFMNKTHCKQGHPIEGRNAMLIHGGQWRQCRICHAKRCGDYQKRRAARERLAAGPLELGNNLSEDARIALERLQGAYVYIDGRSRRGLVRRGLAKEFGRFDDALIGTFVGVKITELGADVLAALRAQVKP